MERTAVRVPDGMLHHPGGASKVARDGGPDLAGVHAAAGHERSVNVAQLPLNEHACARIAVAARMVKLVDTGDLKSPASNGVPVRFRLRAPLFIRLSASCDPSR